MQTEAVRRAEAAVLRIHSIVSASCSTPQDARRVLYGLLKKYFPLLSPGKEFRAITYKELRSTSVYAIRIEEWSGKENWKDRADQSNEWAPLDESWFQ